MENLKTENFDEREEGEISLEDVSSSEETNYGNCNRSSRKSGNGKKHIKREIDIIRQETDYGKENRRFSNELVGTGLKPIATMLQEKNDDLLPISSDEDIELVGLPGTSKQISIHMGPKKKRKKKKKKKSGQRMLVIDDLVSTFDDELSIVGVATDDRRDFLVSRPYEENNERSPSPIQRMNSPPRHNGWHVPSTPPKHYHLPLRHGRSPIHRSPSPRQYLSPRKSPAFNHDRHVSHKPSRDLSPGRHKDAYASSLLKRVRHLERVGVISPVNQQIYKESSLKDKLNNMMIKSLPEDGETIDDRQLEIDSNRKTVIKNEDEEDLEFLRRKALETKHLKNNMSHENDGTINSGSNVGGNTNISDDDEEALELRMIALRSAVIKKHNDRIQRGVVKKKSGTKIKGESPFSDSFLDNLDSYPDDEIAEGDNDSQRTTPLIAQYSENAHVEDMDLDSDVEREKKDSQPYSPTDELSQQTLIEPGSPNESLAETSMDQFPVSEIVQNLSNITIPQYSNSFTPYFNDHIPNVSSSYLPLNQTCESTVQNFPRSEPALSLRDPRLRRHINSSTETFYPSNDTTIFNPALSGPLPTNAFTTMPSNTITNTCSMNSSNLIAVPLANNQNNLSNIVPVPLQHSASLLPLDSNAIDQQSEASKTSTNGIPNSIDKTQSGIMHNDIMRDLAEYANEPLYIQGVPDITKDASKIPTLVNRTLVPVPILKTNKQLQQPLPNRKPESNVEPTFKSAEMLPVNIESQSLKSNTLFKPIKLHPVAKKSELLITPPAAFDNSLIDEANTELPNQQSVQTVETLDNSNGNKSSGDVVNLHVSDKSQRVTIAANEGKTKVRRPKTPRNKADTAKTPQKSSNSEKWVVVPNEKVNNKITVKNIAKTTENVDGVRKIKKSIGDAKKSVVNNPKNNDTVKKSDLKKGNRSKNITKQSEKSDGNTKKNSNSKKNSDSSSKQHKDVVKKVSKPKVAKSVESITKKTNAINENINKSVPSKVVGKKRRSSIDDDEEMLRAALLASLPKRMKTSDLKSTSITDNAQLVQKKLNDAKELSKEQPLSETADMLPPPTAPLRSTGQKTLNQKKITADTAPSTAVAKKHSHTTNIESASKKVAQNSTALSLDGAKILNVAEKMVEAEIQRKLALQQAAIGLLFNKAQQGLKSNVSRSSTKDSTSAVNPKMSASKSMERMIIHLGEDSDSDSDIDDINKKIKTKNVSVGHVKERVKAPTIPITDFEKSVEEFLRAQRERQESLTSATNTTAKSSTPASAKRTSPITHTPLAVRHLPASQQEEYRRLKQRIAEREQQKMNRTVQTTAKNSLQTTINNEESFMLPHTTSKSVTIDDTPLTDTQPQTKNAIPNAIKTPQLTRDLSHKNITIQTQVSKQALELLQSEIKTDVVEDNGTINIQSLLPEIPIKIESSLNETSQNPDEIQKVYDTVVNNPVNESAFELNTIRTTRPLENLTIKFPNTTVENVPFVRHISISRNDNVTNKSTVDNENPKGLRILSTDQLNMKYENEQSDINENEEQIIDQKILLNNNDTIISHDTTMDIDNNQIVNSISLDPCKIETNCDNIESTVLDSQESIDSDASTVVSPGHNNCSTNISNNNKLNSTFEFNSTTMLDSTTATVDIDTINDEILHTPIDIENTISSDVATNSESKLQMQKLSEGIELNVQKKMETIINLPENQQRIELTTMEKELVTERYVVIHKLTEMAEDLSEWKIQTDLIAEVNQLRLQLQAAEKRLQDQRNKIMNMSPHITLAHNKINERRNECIKLTKLCQEVGTKVMGSAYKIPSTGNQLLKEKLREVASMTKQLSKKKEQTINLSNEEENATITSQLTLDKSCNELNSQFVNFNNDRSECSTTIKVENVDDSEITVENMCRDSNSVSIQNNVQVTNEIVETIKDETPSQSQLTTNTNNAVDVSTLNSDWLKIEDEKPPMQLAVSYESVLTSFNTPRRIDPNGVLCPYELMGTCSDEACPYNHLDANRS